MSETAIQNTQNETDLIFKITGVLFISGEGLTINKLSEILNVKPDIINQVIDKVSERLSQSGLVLIQTDPKHNSNLIQIATNPKHDIKQLFYKHEEKEELSPAQLQTLTLITYLKEATSSEISFMRGVQSLMTLRLLAMRGFVNKTGDKYRLSLDSLKYLGISKNEDMKDFEKINLNLNSKLKDLINAE
jgi:segregation and condensation protein B